MSHIDAISEQAEVFEPGNPSTEGLQIYQKTTKYLQIQREIRVHNSFSSKNQNIKASFSKLNQIFIAKYHCLAVFFYVQNRWGGVWGVLVLITMPK